VESGSATSFDGTFSSSAGRMLQQNSSEETMVSTVRLGVCNFMKKSLAAESQ
jgi:hypothetical protein